MEYKVCYKCRKKLPLTSEYFATQNKSSDGFDGRCKSCVNLISKKYRKERGEKYRIDNITWTAFEPDTYEYKNALVVGNVHEDTKLLDGFTLCGDCSHFGGESISGHGWCDRANRETFCGDKCIYE